MIFEPLRFCAHADGVVHPLPPYPQASAINVALLEQLDPRWRDPEDTDVLVFGPDCRYLICEYLSEHHSFALSRIS
jgi:hypothetical protein